jgi:hypothetical protein
MTGLDKFFLIRFFSFVPAEKLGFGNCTWYSFFSVYPIGFGHFWFNLDSAAFMQDLKPDFGRRNMGGKIKCCDS